MNDKITFPRLATLIADTSGRSKRFSEDFLREFFSLISENLDVGESVKIKGLGTFRLSRVEPRRSVDVTTGEPMEISGHSKIVFIPSKEIAEAVNAPFEAFTAQEIPDGADLGFLFGNDEIALHANPEENSPISEMETGTESEFSSSSEPTPITESSDSDIPDESNEGFNEAEPSTTPLEVEPVDTAEEPAYTDKEDTSPEDNSNPAANADETEACRYASEQPDSQQCEPEDTTGDNEDLPEEEADDDPNARRRKSWSKILMISMAASVVALLAIAGLWYVFAADNFHNAFSKLSASIRTTPFAEEAKNVDESPTADVSVPPAEDSTEEELSDTEEEVPTAPSDVAVYDTISATRFLTSMARTHYGNFNFWPYIYEENKAKLGHPDRIRPGTPVVIPKLSKYGVDPTDKEDIEKAKRLGVEIYARYGKKI